MALSLEERADPGHGMLIVVDMQNDFCHRQGGACKRGRDMDFVQNMIPRLIRLVKQAREQNFPICFVAIITIITTCLLLYRCNFCDSFTLRT